MKTQSSPESGYFNRRVTFLLCICGVWLAAMSFAPSASAWNIKYGGSPGSVTWASENQPVIGMGYNSPGSGSIAIYRGPTIGMSPAGTNLQYATVTLYVYYWGSGQWHYYSHNTAPPVWRHYGETVTYSNPGTSYNYGRDLDVTIPTTGNLYWTSIIQIVWYNTSYQWVAWENFYPTNLTTTTRYGWHGNADMAINTYAEGPGLGADAGRPGGAGGGYNLNSPTGYIYVLFN